MIERLHTAEKMSKIVKHNGVAYLCGQVGEGETVRHQSIETPSCCYPHCEATT